MNKFVLNAQGEPERCDDIIEWGRFFEDFDNRRIARDEIGEILVSTVFLGMDHRFLGEGPPILYETMIFGGGHDEYQERCCTRAQALEMHAKACRIARGQQEPG